MIKNFCDRCGVPIGDQHDGSAWIPKTDVTETAKIVNPAITLYEVCDTCKQALINHLTAFAQNK